MSQSMVQKRLDGACESKVKIVKVQIRRPPELADRRVEVVHCAPIATGAQAGLPGAVKRCIR